MIISNAVHALWSLKPFRLPYWLILEQRRWPVYIPSSYGVVKCNFRYIPTVIGLINEIHINDVYCRGPLKPIREDVIIDIGAFIGLYTLRVANFVSKVIALEPHPESYRLLMENLKINKVSNAMAFPYAIWNREGKVKLFLSPEGKDSHSLVIPRTSNYIKVNALTLDRLCNLLKLNPTIIKMDIEGAEYEALKGAESLINRGETKFAIATYHFRGEYEKVKRLFPNNYVTIKLEGGKYLYAIPKSFFRNEEKSIFS